MDDPCTLAAVSAAEPSGAAAAAARRRTGAGGDFVLDWRRLPARLTSAQAAALLGFQPHDISVLIRETLLRPLGAPAPNAPRYFWSGSIEELARDVEWLATATNALSAHWQRKNRALTSSKPTGKTRRRRSRYSP